ncbi:MAG TPA: TonB-dependent receptor plug domain-containing protein, partial [Saprospiraceae bacterium]|nr:TonB-dependent receptor plug domain-containing protein [Saprospiraceae bacterium]
MKRFLFTLVIALSVMAASAQRNITGRISDLSTGEALIGATVSIKNGSTGTITDTNGDFTLEIPNDQAVLLVSYTGYETAEAAVGTQSRVDVQLTASSTLVDEVVVIGYGKQIKSTLTGNIAKVGGENLKSMPVISVEQAMQGQAAGVFVESVNGKVGGAMRVRVRGVGSINAGTEPLYVIDGIPIAKDARNTAGAPLNPMADLNFNDIESIEVLKDASAKAIYGARGSNGVVIITTKSGKSGRSRIELDVQSGASMATGKREFLNAAEYYELFTEAANNSDDIDGVPYDDIDSWTTFLTIKEYPDGTLGRLYRYSGYNDDWLTPVDRTDWQEEALRTGSVTNANLSLSGGN